MFENHFKRIDKILREESGTSGATDYVEQTSWILFLKYLDDLQKNKSIDAELVGKQYDQILDDEYMWENWAAPKDADGKLNKTKALTGEDLTEFVGQKLFPYLKSFKDTVEDPETIEYKIGEIFGEIKNKIQSGENLREIIDIIDGMEFRSRAEMHDLSHLYEQKLKDLGGEGKSSGEYYTPRPLIEAMVNAVDPEIGERVYDGAAGSGGFLVEAYNHMHTDKLTAKKLKKLHEETLYGKEKKPIPYILGVMNMILHGIEAPNILRTNTLTENLADVQEKDRFDVILANPPFGGSIRKEVRDNFPINTGETAYLFLQHFMKMLKAGGRGGIVIKNTFLSNGDAKAIRKELLENYNLHTVLDLPPNTFKASSSAGVHTVVLFFEKGAPTRKIWYHELDPGRTLGKTSPLEASDFEEFHELWKTRANSEHSWTVAVKDIDTETYDLSVKNPHTPEEEPLRSPEEILAEMKTLDKESVEILEELGKEKE